MSAGSPSPDNYVQRILDEHVHESGGLDFVAYVVVRDGRPVPTAVSPTFSRSTERGWLSRLLRRFGAPGRYLQEALWPDRRLADLLRRFGLTGRTPERQVELWLET